MSRQYISEEQYLSEGVLDIVDYFYLYELNGIKVLVDGIEINGVFNASAIDGFADFFVIDESGKYVCEDGVALRERVYGKVEFLLNNKLVELKG